MCRWHTCKRNCQKLLFWMFSTHFIFILHSLPPCIFLGWHFISIFRSMDELHGDVKDLNESLGRLSLLPPGLLKNHFLYSTVAFYVIIKNHFWHLIKHTDTKLTMSLTMSFWSEGWFEVLYSFWTPFCVHVMFNILTFLVIFNRLEW